VEAWACEISLKAGRVLPVDSLVEMIHDWYSEAFDSDDVVEEPVS